MVKRRILVTDLMADACDRVADTTRYDADGIPVSNELADPKADWFAVKVGAGEAPRDAAAGSGYSPGTAYALMKREDVKARIAEIREVAVQMALDKVVITKEWVLAELVDNVLIAKTAVPVRDKKGKETGVYQIDLGAANRGLELIGKELGMFVEKREVTLPSLGEFLAAAVDNAAQANAIPHEAGGTGGIADKGGGVDPAEDSRSADFSPPRGIIVAETVQ